MKKIIFTALLLSAFTFGYSQSDYYNDYRNSITSLDWQSVAANLLLSSSQKQQLFALNNQYSDYDSWNRVYGNNPERWRTDRYSSMQRIFGAEKYTKFKNKYYKGQNPVAVYNRNKNNDMRYKHLSKKSKVYKANKSSKAYKKGNSGKSKHK